MRHIPDEMMLFAAGFGTRMGTLTENRPKPLIEVAGRALIDHALDIARGAKLRRVVVNTHYLADQIHSHLGDDILISNEEPHLLDTGGGLKHASHFFTNDAIFTLNSDMVWKGPNPADVLNERWQPEQMDALLLCLPLSRAIGRSGAGDFTLCPDGRLARQGPIVYTGTQIIKRSLVEHVQKSVFSLNEAWDLAIAEHRLYGTIYPGQWCDVGHPEGIARAEAMLTNG